MSAYEMKMMIVNNTIDRMLRKRSDLTEDQRRALAEETVDRVYQQGTWAQYADTTIRCSGPGCKKVPTSKRELRDYVGSARLCLRWDSVTHVLSAQDDALAGEALLDRLVPAVDAADAEARDHARPWLYIKLFRTGFFAGWSWDPERMAELPGAETGQDGCCSLRERRAARPAARPARVRRHGALKWHTRSVGGA
jgi:hypothetical protein